MKNDFKQSYINLSILKFESNKLEYLCITYMIFIIWIKQFFILQTIYFKKIVCKINLFVTEIYDFLIFLRKITNKKIHFLKIYRLWYSLHKVLYWMYTSFVLIKQFFYLKMYL